MKKVLFVCIENACRSQIAEAIYNKYAKKSIAYSAGSNPAENIDPLTIQIMEEAGFDLGNKKPTGYTPFLGEKFDVIVTMGCKEACPITPTKKTIKWDIPDTKGKSINAFREVRGIIELKVKKLLKIMEEKTDLKVKDDKTV